MSEALILGSTNPQYDKRLFIDLPVQYMTTTNSEHIVYINCSECQNKNQFVYKTCSELGLFMYSTGNSMNNLFSYCELFDARISVSEKGLPVLKSSLFSFLWYCKPEDVCYDLTQYYPRQFSCNILVL